MMVTLYNGVSGIKTNSYGLDVSANNIANINTVGYKGSTPEFKDIFYQTNIVGSLNPVYSQVGLGTSVATTSINLSDGNFQNTDSPYDLAIAGDGYFAVSSLNSTTTPYYTKAGEYMLDKNADLVNSTGLYLLGTMANVSSTTYSQAAIDNLGISDSNALTITPNVNLDFSNNLSKINLPNNLYIPSSPTTFVNFSGSLNTTQEFGFMDIQLNLQKQNLQINDNIINFSANITDTAEFDTFNAGDEVIVTFTNQNAQSLQARTTIDENGNFALENFDLSQIGIGSTSNNFSISATAAKKVEIATTAKFSSALYTQSGYENTLTINLSKQVPSSNDGTNYNATAIITDKDGNEISRSNGVLSFNAFGALSQNYIGVLNNSGTPLSVNFGSLYNANVANSGFDGLVLSANETSITNVQRDGYSDGLLKDYSISTDGNVVATFSNGMQANIAKIPIFHFQNDQGLYSDGGVLFSKTSNSGEPFMYTDENGNKYNGSSINSYMLETSNVSLSNEFTMLIVQQRAYEASAKSITTADEMLQRAINMKNN